MPFKNITQEELITEMETAISKAPLETRFLSKIILELSVDFIKNTREFGESIKETIERENFTLTYECFQNLAFSNEHSRAVRTDFSSFFNRFAIKNIEDSEIPALKEKFEAAADNFKSLGLGDNDLTLSTTPDIDNKKARELDDKALIDNIVGNKVQNEEHQYARSFR
jgi:hypothetical protein